MTDDREDTAPDRDPSEPIDAHDAGGTATDRQWRFDVDEVDENGVVDVSIEPEAVDRENAVFVLFGVVLAVLILARTVAVFA